MWRQIDRRLFANAIISTHTSHAGCDCYASGKGLNNGISTHTSHSGCDQEICPSVVGATISTHTSHAGCDFGQNHFSVAGKQFQPTHPMRDVTPYYTSLFLSFDVSTHTSHTGCDDRILHRTLSIGSFQPTHPIWDVTVSIYWWIWTHLFQPTHPIRDVTLDKIIFRWQENNFNPHIPFGMWQHIVLKHRKKILISTHTSHTGCDREFCPV